jgi:3-hydroxyisobutyrate dehydrogenase-like beta-hydroxyacid dehydrogenase
MTNPTIGVVGLGNMGVEIASRLAAARAVVAFDLSEQARAQSAGRGIPTADSLAGLGDCDQVVLSLPRPEASRAVVGELAGVLRPGTLVIETSTVNATDMHRLGAQCADADLRCIDAAVLSGVGAMRDGTSTLLVGGDAAEVDRARATLEGFSARQIVLGELGAGMAAKVINNAVAHATMVVLVEAVALARAAGIRLDDIASLLADAEGGLIRPLTHRIQERVANDDYLPGMPMDAARKDSVLALEYAQSQNVPLFAIQGSHSVYEMAVAEGLGRLDYAAISTLWDRWRDGDAHPPAPTPHG